MTLSYAANCIIRGDDEYQLLPNQSHDFSICDLAAEFELKMYWLIWSNRFYSSPGIDSDESLFLIRLLRRHLTNVQKHFS